MWPFTASPAASRDRIAPVPPSLDVQNASLENPTTALNPANWLLGALGAEASFAGPTVSETSAMRQTAVYRCVALKSGVIGGLPLQVFKRTPNGRELATDHRLYRLLHDEPNDLMSAFIWKELIACNLMLAGNHYSVIEYDNAVRVVGLLPVMPQGVGVERVKGRNRYTFHFSDGKEVLDQADVLHVPGLGFDGMKGISPIAWAGKQPIGVALAMEEFVGRIHANGVRPSGVVNAPPGIQAEGLRRLRAEVDALHAGVAKAGRTLLLDSGAKWESMSLTLADAQTLEHRKFQIGDIARLFGVPPHMVGETEKSTSWGTGIEQITIGFQKFNIDFELSRIEGELNRKLFVPPYYCEFNRDALNAMDSKAQAELFASALQNAGMTPNEIRRKRNLPDVEGGNELYIQGGTVPLRLAGKQSATPPTPTPPRKDEPPAEESEE